MDTLLISMVKIFGRNFEGEPYFIDPADKNRKIYVILDPPHMLELAVPTWHGTPLQTTI